MVQKKQTTKKPAVKPKTRTRTKKISLNEKLYNIMVSVGFIQKDKRNEYHHYNYLSEEAIKKAIHKELVKERVVFNLQLDEYQRNGSLTTVRVRYRFIDVDSKDELTGSFYGDGGDTGDKGLYKAITGAIKYIMTSTFLIPTGDDPEVEQEKSVQVEEPKIEPEKKKPENEQPLEVKEKGDSYAQLLTELNSVQDKETLAKAQEHMDRVKDDLTSTQLSEAIKLFADLKKKYN